MRKPLLVQAYLALLALVFVALPVLARAADGGIVALTPRPNDRLAKAPVVIAIQLPGGPHVSVDKSAVRLVVDGRDVSDAVTVTGTRVEYKPSPPLMGGEHAVQVEYSDPSGGRLSYAWTFTVEGGAPPQQAADATSAALRSIGLPDDGSAGMNAGASAAAQPPNGDASGDTGTAAAQQVYQTQNYYAGGYGGYGGYGGFYPIGGGPYYWGDNAMFQFVGVPGGYGFLTFGGIPGFFNLMPLGINTFYAVIPIPIGYYFSSPFITCHYFFPSGGGTVVGLPSFPIVRHRRPPARSAVVGRSLQLPQGASGRSTALTSTMPAGGAVRATRPGVGTRPVGAHPIFRAPSPMRPVTAPHILAPQPIVSHPISAPHPVVAPVLIHPVSLSVPVGHIR